MPTVSSTLKVIEGVSGAYGTGASNNTPVVVAREMVNKLDVDWSNPNLKILDPCCGFGTFLVLVYEKLRQHGHSPKHIVENMIYGNDINKAKATIAASVLSKLAQNDTTIYNMDALEGGFNDMEFDVVLGNPPYQKSKEDGSRMDQASNLWSVFWSYSIKKFTKKNGIVALVTPTSWLSPSSDIKGSNKINGYNRLWDYFNSVSSYANVKDVAKHFKVGSTFGYVIVNKSGKNGLKFSDGASTKLGFLPKSNYEEVEERIDLVNNLASKFEMSQSQKHKLRVRFCITKSVNQDSIEITDKEVDDQDKTMYYCIYPNSMEEAIKIKQTLTNSVDVINKHCRWVGFVNLKVVGLLKYDYA